MYNYTQDQARPGVHFRELGEIDARQGNVIIGDDFGADHLERKKSYREPLTRFFTLQLNYGRWIRTNDRRMANGGLVLVQVDITEVKNPKKNCNWRDAKPKPLAKPKLSFLPP
jgi:two-component system, cell cycle sensor histidine kinase PleC